MQHPTMRAATPPPMPFIELQTLRVHYEQAGSGRNMLVLVHGNFASTRWWKPVLDSLPTGWRAYAIDLRGCGRTESSSCCAAGRTDKRTSVTSPSSCPLATSLAERGGRAHYPPRAGRRVLFPGRRHGRPVQDFISPLSGGGSGTGAPAGC